MSLHAIIQAAYPGTDPLTDYELRDDSDGRGPYLAAWHIAGPVPAGVPTMDSPVRRWYSLSQALCKVATLEIIDKTATPQRIYATAGLEAIITSAAEGDVEPGITRQQLEEMAALWRSFAAWSETPLEDAWAHGKSPLQILSELGGA